MNNVNIIFYSKDCKFSEQLITFMHKINILQKFKLISVDNNNNLPPNITRVPTLIVSNINKPLVGTDAFNWLKTINQFNQYTGNINVKVDNDINKQNNPLLLNALNSNIKTTEPFGYSINEVCRLSDNYAFINSNDNDVRYKNISYINDNNELIFTAPEKNTINNENQNKKLNQLINKRTEQIHTLNDNKKFTSINYNQQMLEQNNMPQIRNEAFTNYNPSMNKKFILHQVNKFPHN